MQELGPVYVKFGQSVSTRQDVLPDDAVIVEKLDFAARLPGIFDFRVANEPELGTRCPGVTKYELEGMIDFLETQRVAEHALVEITLRVIAAGVLGVERFPDQRLAILPDADQGTTTGMTGRVVNPVDRDVREEGEVRRHAPRRQCAR